MKCTKCTITSLIVSLLLTGHAGCSPPSCRDSTIHFVGLVTDNNLMPLAEVQVILYGGTIDVQLAVTNIDGTYAATGGGTPYSGIGVKFVKTGYQVAVAEPFLLSEAGPDICRDDITLRRDAILQPE